VKANCSYQNKKCFTHVQKTKMKLLITIFFLRNENIHQEFHRIAFHNKNIEF